MFNGEYHALFRDGVVRRIPRGIGRVAIIIAIGRSDGIPQDIETATEKARGKKEPQVTS